MIELLLAMFLVQTSKPVKKNCYYASVKCFPFSLIIVKLTKQLSKKGKVLTLLKTLYSVLSVVSAII